MVSVIIPNYNGEKYIKETIESVLCQTYPCFEIIVVDDGSTDNSEEVVRKFNDERISFYRRSDSYPKGANACRNIGIEKSKGEYIVFLDSDDLFARDCLLNRINYLANHKKIDFAVFHSIKFWKDKNKGYVFTKLKGYEPIRHFLCTENLWQTSSVIWRADFVRSIGGYNLAYQRLQDPEMTLRALLASNGNYSLVDESIPDFYYRRPPNLSDKKEIISYRSIMQYVRDFYIDENKCYIDYEISFKMFFSLSLFHLKRCSGVDDENKYKDCVQILMSFNPAIKDNLVYKVCMSKSLFPKFKENVFLIKCVRYYIRFYRKCLLKRHIFNKKVNIINANEFIS